MPRYQQARDVLSRRGTDRWSLLAVGGESVFVAMGTAVDVWDALERELTVEELVGGLATRFGVEADTVLTDVLHLLNELRIRRLVEVSDR